MYETKQFIRILPVYIVNAHEQMESSINVGGEFDSLIDTLGAKIVARVIQKMDRPNSATYIGSGKIEEIGKQVHDQSVDVVVIDALLKPGQLHLIKTMLEVENPDIQIWDRVELVLRIFEKNAHTKDAKLQIELARMNYMGPRIYGMGYVLSRQGGGIGTLGIGETNTELMKRHWRNEKKKITDELEKNSKNREGQLERRKKTGFKTVSIVGYTNVGKSSLFNVLAKKENLEKNELFATLDSAVGKMYIPDLHAEVLISDTIGFIRNLPPLLISAFKSTLMESIHADLVLHVIDASDPEMTIKMQVVYGILQELGIDNSQVVYIFNKIDLVPDLDISVMTEKYKENTPIFISVKENKGIDSVLSIITTRLS